MIEPLTGWGRMAPSVPVEVLYPATADSLRVGLCDPPRRGVITRGLGRSYGDAAQNGGGRVIDVSGVTRIGPIDPDHLITVSAGASIGDLLRVIVPQGFFVPVSPGTRHVTIGGAIASDIHGKNHHASGTFGMHVRSLRLALPSSEVVTCGPDERSDLFWATTGGMGLTGAVLEATIALPSIESSMVSVHTERAVDLDTCMALMEEGDDRYTHTVAWVDLTSTGRTMGRSVLSRGDFAHRSALRGRDATEPLRYEPHRAIKAPPAPSGLFNKMTVRAFNELWFHKSPRQGRSELQSIPAFFHPLDMIDGWNRLYGPRGFQQWQCVVPFGEEPSLRRVVETLNGSRFVSFLAVLKRFGAASPGPLSFPMPGWTLALDIPTPGRRGNELATLLDRLDRLVINAGGRLYLAKDSRMSPETFRTGYPRFDEWLEVRATVDPNGVLQSDLARRLRFPGTE